MGSLSQFEEYAGPLLRGHFSTGKRVRGIGILKAVEKADYFLHTLILRQLFDCGAVDPALPQARIQDRRQRALHE